MKVRRASDASNVLFEKWIVSANAMLNNLRNDVLVIHEPNKKVRPMGLQCLDRCMETVLIALDTLCSLWRKRFKPPSLNEKFALFVIAGDRQLRLQSGDSSVVKLLCGFVEKECISNNGGLPQIVFKYQIADTNVV
jgi:hypothetical protein